VHPAVIVVALVHPEVIVVVTEAKNLESLVLARATTPVHRASLRDFFKAKSLRVESLLHSLVSFQAQGMASPFPHPRKVPRSKACSDLQVLCNTFAHGFLFAVQGLGENG
jgi:hypothetical protein